jgi:hypothetical protein
MLPDHDGDYLQGLLHESYSAPRLDDRFSADLIGRLQTEAAPSSTPRRTRWSPSGVCLGAAAVAASVIAAIWVANLGLPGPDHEVARRASTDSDQSARLVGSNEVNELGATQNVKSSPIDDLSASSTHHSVAVVPVPAQASTAPATNNHGGQRRSISAMVAHADMLYVVDSGQLYEVRPIDGSRRIVGHDDWQNTTAMGAAGGHLYIVSDNQLYEVNPTTGARRSFGKPDWAETKAIVTVGDRLYIVANGLLQRVNPNDGSHEVFHSKNDGTNGPSKPKQ